MTEEERHVSFDEQALGRVLGTHPATVRNVAYGEGQLFSTGHGAARLEVFPQTGVEFHRSQPDQQASLTVLPGGGVVFTVVASAEPTPTSTPSAEAPDRPEPVPPPGQGLETARKPAPEPASPSGAASPGRSA